MTVSVTSGRVAYLTNGTTGPWTVPFYFIADDHLSVVHKDSAGVETTLTLTTDYTVSGAGNTAGGTVTTVTAYGAGGTITIVRNVPRTQEVDYRDADEFPAETHEAALDKLTMIAQQQDEVLGRALVLSVGSSGSGLLPSIDDRKNKYLSFDSNGDATATSPSAGTAEALATDLLATGATDGAAMVGFINAGTGAVTRTVQARLRDTVSVADFGTVGDGSTDDTTALQAALDTGRPYFGAATGYLVSSLTIGASTYVQAEGRKAPVKLSGAGGLQVTGSNVQVDGLRIDGVASDQTIYSAASVQNVLLRGLDITTNTGATNGIGIQVNAASTGKWSLQGSNLDVEGYGVLLNDSAGGSAGYLIQNSFIDSVIGDSVEVNSPTTSIEDVVISGVIGKVTGGSNPNAGFTYGFANVDGFILANTISQQSRQQSHHIEDGSRNGVVVGNIAKACPKSGMRIIVGGSGGNEAASKPPVVIGNVYEAATAATDEAGIYVVFDGDGTVANGQILGNTVRGFQSGLWLGGDASHHAHGNLIENATYAIRCEQGNNVFTRITGTNYVRNCTNLFRLSSATGAGVRVGKFVCADKPTSIVSKAGSSRPGVTVEGFSWPQNMSHGGTGNEFAVLFAQGTRFVGTIDLQIVDTAATTANNAWLTATLHFDGTTLTISNSTKEENGAIALGATPLRVNGGNLEVDVYVAAATTLRIDVNFDGTYYV